MSFSRSAFVSDILDRFIGVFNDYFYTYILIILLLFHNAHYSEL